MPLGMPQEQGSIEDLIKKHTGGAQTSPLQQPQVPQNGSPALAPGPGPASNAPAQAVAPQAGAGGTSAKDKLIGQTDPKMSIDTAEQTAQAISSKTGATAKAGPQAIEQKKQLNQALAAQGVDPKDAFESLYNEELSKLEQRHKAGEITKKEYKGWKNRWKNIFNTVPEEDFGLFMMDFGLRLMSASTTEPFAGALGQAGHGALTGALQRKEQKGLQSQQREQQAFDRALAKAGLEKDRPAQVESTEQGLIERGPDGSWRPIINPETGKPYKREYAGSQGYRGEKSWLYDWGKRIGKSEDELWEIVNGQMSEGERRDKYEELILKMISDAKYTDTDPILQKKYRDFQQQDIQLWIENMMGGRRGALQ